METGPRKTAIFAFFRVFPPLLRACPHNTIGLNPLSFSQKSLNFQNNLSTHYEMDIRTDGLRGVLLSDKELSTKEHYLHS